MSTERLALGTMSKLNGLVSPMPKSKLASDFGKLKTLFFVGVVKPCVTVWIGLDWITRLTLTVKNSIIE